MSAFQQLLALTILSYFLGSIPFGLLVGLSKGIDPRKSGSGNIGATNVARLLGGKFFALVFTLDLLKSLLPMLVGAYILHRAGYQLSLHSNQLSSKLLLSWLLVGFAAVLGHMFPIYLRFKGGKGVATSAGLILGLWPYYTLPAIASLLLFLLTFKIWRYVSLSSMLAASSFPITYTIAALLFRWPLLHEHLPLLIFSILVAALILYKHRTNISRLRAGTEQPFRPHPSAQ